MLENFNRVWNGQTPKVNTRLVVCKHAIELLQILPGHFNVVARGMDIANQIVCLMSWLRITSRAWWAATTETVADGFAEAVEKTARAAQAGDDRWELDGSIHQKNYVCKLQVVFKWVSTLSFSESFLQVTLVYRAVLRQKGLLG